MEVSHNSSVTKVIFDFILTLQQLPSLSNFALGGGTSLALIYNHRESTDIDLFTSDKLVIKQVEQIVSELKNIDCILNVRAHNINKENMSKAMISADIQPPNHDIIKIDIITNFKLMFDVETISGIRFVNIKDIGYHKLRALENRGTRKDFYDLFFITKNTALGDHYDNLIKWLESVKMDNYEDVFSEGIIHTSLIHSLTKLTDFNNAADNSQRGNKFKENKSVVSESWIDIQKIWKKKVIELSKSKGIKHEETKAKRSYKKRGKGF